MKKSSKQHSCTKRNQSPSSYRDVRRRSVCSSIKKSDPSSHSRRDALPSKVARKTKEDDARRSQVSPVASAADNNLSRRNVDNQTTNQSVGGMRHSSDKSNCWPSWHSSNESAIDDCHGACRSSRGQKYLSTSQSRWLTSSSPTWRIKTMNSTLSTRWHHRNTLCVEKRYGRPTNQLTRQETLHIYWTNWSTPLVDN